MRVAVLCLFVCQFVFVTQVFAIPVTFDFSVDVSLERPDLFMLVDGVALAITASDANDAVAEISQTDDGLGVYRGNSDSKVLDSGGIDDVLSLSFSELVTLQYVHFSSVEAGDSFSLLVDGGTGLNSLLTDELFDFSVFALTGNLFVFSAVLDNADYRIRSITVDAPVPTPEPATWLMLCCGLTGLLCWRRKFAL